MNKLFALKYFTSISQVQNSIFFNQSNYTLQVFFNMADDQGNLPTGKRAFCFNSFDLCHRYGLGFVILFINQG